MSDFGMLDTQVNIYEHQGAPYYAPNNPADYLAALTSGQGVDPGLNKLLPAIYKLPAAQGVTTMATNGYAPITTTSPLGTSLSWGGDLFGLTNTGLGLNLPTLSLAYGLYSLILKRKRGLMPIAALAYGAYGTGILGQLLPKNETGGVDMLKTTAMAVSPTLGWATVAGIAPALLMGLFALMKGRGRRRTFRGRRSYARAYRPTYSRRWRRY